LLFRDLRDLNFANVGQYLSRFAHRLDADYKSRHQAKTVAQLKDFVGKMGGLQSETQLLKIHTGISELLNPMTRTELFNKSLEIQQNLLASFDINTQISAIEDLVAQGSDLFVILRLLCLASIVSPGIKPKVLEGLKRDILQTYGYSYLPLLLNLSSLHLLSASPLPPAAQTYKLPLSNVRKSLRLLSDDSEPEPALEKQPNDINYVYSGYAPLSIRLVQCVAQKGAILTGSGTNTANAQHQAEKEEEDDIVSRKKANKVRAHPIVGWKGFDDIVTSLPGETFDVSQKTDGEPQNNGGGLSVILPREETMTTVVFFLGGCTYTEIAALRWMSKQTQGRRFLIACTGIIKGSSMLEDLAASN